VVLKSTSGGTNKYHLWNNAGTFASSRLFAYKKMVKKMVKTNGKENGRDK